RLVRGAAFANLSPETLQYLAAHPSVRYIEEDRPSTVLSVQDVSSPSGMWGLDRMDERAKVLDSDFRYYFDGDDVHIYIVDSGIRGDHTEFTGRFGTSVAKLSFSWGASPFNDPCNHGTAVASAAAGTT